MKLFWWRCYNGGKKHKFKPRYSEKPTGMGVSGGFSGTYRCLKALMCVEVYEGDVCTWCGNVVNTKEQP